MDKKFHFVYCTTNIVNGKQYVGDHSTNDLDDGYLGSGRPLFEDAKLKYGKENFKREILEFFDTKQDAYDAQEKYIDKYNTLAPNGYNLSPTGGIGMVGCFSDKTLKLFSDLVSGENNPMYGKTNYALWVKKYGKEEADKRMEIFSNRISKLNSGENNPFYGKTHNNEAKQKVSKTHKGKKLSEDHKRKIKENLPDFSGKKHNNYGKKWITNLKLNKRKLVLEEELYIYLNDSWIKGKHKLK